MKLMAKLMWITALCVAVLGFVSCKADTGDKSNGAGAVVDENVIFSPYVNTSVILGEGVAEADVKSLRTAYYKQLGKDMTVSNSTAAPAAHEIIIGKNGRELSEKAYRYLVALENDKGYVGYVICSDGKSVAIAYNEKSFGENVAFDEAMNFFINKYMKQSSLKFNPGVVHYESFDPIARQSERDAEELEIYWNYKLTQLTEKTERSDDAEAIIEELKAFWQFLAADNDITAWLANLYDPGTGGFYYSNSARNNETYLPDLESTHQAINLVETILTGYRGTLTDYFGEEIAEKFVTFVNSMQAEDNGYFYHPQWPREAIDKNTARLTKDLDDAVGILNIFGASPKYDTPNGITGGETVTPVSVFTTPLAKSAVTAVSYVASTAAEDEEIYLLPHFKSESDFKNHIKGLSINKNTVSSFETILSELSQYKAVDKFMEKKGEKPFIINTLLNTLKIYQHGNGTWSDDKNAYAAFATLSTSVKVYNALGVPIAGYSDIFAAAEKLLAFSDEFTHISEISSIWSALADVVENLSCYTQDKEDKAELDWRLAALYSSLGESLSTTKAAVGKFIRDDGSFSSTIDGNAHTVYDMPMSVHFMVEGDMNGTFTVINTVWNSIFRVLNVVSMPLFTTSDRMFFQKTLSDMGIIIKNELKSAEPIDFEKYNIGDTADVGTHFITVGESYVKVVEDPDSERGGKSLHTYSPTSATAAEYVSFGVSAAQTNASCYVVSLDMYINEETSKNMFAQIQIFKDVYILGIVRRNDEIRFVEKGAQGFADADIADVGVSAPLNQWFNIRIEFYPGTRETVRTKIYYNDECICVSDVFKFKDDISKSPSKSFTDVILLAYPNYTMDMYIDNIISESTYKSYTVEELPIGYRNIDTPDGEQLVHDFQNGILPSGMVATGGNVNAFITTDINDAENKVLAVNQKAGTVTFPINQRGNGANVNAALVEFDLTISPDTKKNAMYQLDFNEYGYYYLNKRMFASMQILVQEDKNTKEKYAVLADTLLTTSGTTGAIGTTFSSVKLELGKKYNLSFYLFFEEGITVAAINGEIVGISLNVQAAAKTAYMGEILFTAKKPVLTSAFYIDNLVAERAKVDLEALTKDYNYENLSLLKYTTGNGNVTAYSFAKSTIEEKILWVLQMQTEKDSEDKLEVKLGETNTDANAVTFESYIKITPASDTVTMYLEPKNADDAQPFRLALTAEKNGKVMLNAVDSNGQLDFNASNIELGNSGDWIKLKIEYMNPDADYTGDKIKDGYYNIYVNDNLITTGNTNYTTNSNFDPLTLNNFVFTITGDSVADIYVNDTRFYQSIGKPEDPPEFEENFGKPLGNQGTFNPGEWT